MKNVTVVTAALVLVLGIAGYTVAQSAGPQGGMMGQGMGGHMMGQGGMMSGGMMGWQFLIDGRLFDMNRADRTSVVGQVEQWEFVNP